MLFVDLIQRQTKATKKDKRAITFRRKMVNLLPGLKVLCANGKIRASQLYLVRGSPITDETHKYLPVRTPLVLSSCLGCDRIVMRWKKVKKVGDVWLENLKT